jgi:hypothetical protein
MSRVSRKTEIAFLAAVILSAIFTFSIWALRISAPPRLSITLVGYTNDASGVRLAQVSVTNLNTEMVAIYFPIIMVQTAVGVDAYGLHPPAPASTLKPGAFEIFTVPETPDQLRWKFKIFCDPQAAARHGIRRIALALGDVIHAARGSQSSTYSFESDWISGDNGTNAITNTVSAP